MLHKVGESPNTINMYFICLLISILFSDSKTNLKKFHSFVKSLLQPKEEFTFQYLNIFGGNGEDRKMDKNVIKY